MLLNNQWITEEIKEEIKVYLEANENESMTIQNLWDSAKAVLRGKLTVIQSYIRKQEKSQINNPTLYLKQLKEHSNDKIIIITRVIEITNSLRGLILTFFFPLYILAVTAYKSSEFV